MSVKIIYGTSDPDWDQYSDLFFNNFTPDDWDYMIVGDKENRNIVEYIARKLEVYYTDMKEIDEKWVAVTYHS